MRAMEARPQPDWQNLLDSVHTELASERGCGEVAAYIPPLAAIDPRHFGIAVATVDGRLFTAGDARKRFSVQSISKVFTLALALRHAGDALWQRVGREPSGNRFNSLVQLEFERGVPRNPFINAGALVVTDVILGCLADAKRTVLELVRGQSGSDDLQFDAEVARGERETGHRNRAMAWLMKDLGNLRHAPEQLLDAYFHHCALSMSCVEVAMAGLFLARGGRGADGVSVIDADHSKHVDALMLTCGTYDAAGDFAYRVGLPAKSGVGGGILAIRPRQFAACVWSPGLDAAGNSLLGARALSLLATRAGMPLF
jgi:glutaminase